VSSQLSQLFPRAAPNSMLCLSLTYVSISDLGNMVLVTEELKHGSCLITVGYITANLRGNKVVEMKLCSAA
jgi:hypothetical protein